MKRNYLLSLCLLSTLTLTACGSNTTTSTDTSEETSSQSDTTEVIETTEETETAEVSAESTNITTLSYGLSDMDVGVEPIIFTTDNYYIKLTGYYISDSSYYVEMETKNTTDTKLQFEVTSLKINGQEFSDYYYSFDDMWGTNIIKADDDEDCDIHIYFEDLEELDITSASDIKDIEFTLQTNTVSDDETSISPNNDPQTISITSQIDTKDIVLENDTTKIAIYDMAYDPRMDVYEIYIIAENYTDEFLRISVPSGNKKIIVNGSDEAELKYGNLVHGLSCDMGKFYFNASELTSVSSLDDITSIMFDVEVYEDENRNNNYSLNTITYNR